jgi:hypothetical protein
MLVTTYQNTRFRIPKQRNVEEETRCRIVTYFSTLKLEAAGSFEMRVNTYQTTRLIPEDNNFRR